MIYKYKNLYSLKMKSSNIREKIEVREISKEVFSKFKKVRDLQSHLYGSYQLYSKNGLKYIGKQLKENFQLLSTRSPSYPIFKYNNNDSSIFLFSLHGQPVVNLLSKSQTEGEIKGWIQKCGSVQMALFDVLKKMLRVLQNQGEVQIILQCLRVYNGQLQYCYDNWMESSYQIVKNHPKQLENYYFSKEDLDNIKNYSQKGTFSSPSKKTYIYRIFLMILHLGTYNIKERNYEFDGIDIHYQHLQTRLEHFCSKYNQKGLGSLLKKVIRGESIAMEQLWKFTNPQISKSNKSRKILSISNVNIVRPKTKNMTDNSQCSQQTPIKNSQINKLNCSIFSHQSNKSRKQQQNPNETGKYSQYKFSSSNCENWSQISQTKSPLSRSLASENINKGKKDTKLKNSCKKDKYQLFSNNFQRESLNIKTILQQMIEIPPNNVKFLNFFSLQEYLPQNVYQQQVLELFFSIHIKSSWVKQTYDNGSIYLGDIVSGKKEGKGLYLFNSNDLYFGDWQGNYMDGYGTYIFITGEIYQGQLKKGFKEGHGKCIYPDGKSYEGFWSKNCKVGLGKVKFPNQVIFIGLFHANNNQTQGIFIGPIGQQGKPLWQNKGVLQHYHWQDNVLIDKKIKNEDILQRKQKLKHCKTQYYSTHIDDYHNSYEGQMINGKKHGFGIYQSPSETYEGHWLDDKKNGLGTLYIKNSCHITGQWKNNILVKYICQQIDQPL